MPLDLQPRFHDSARTRSRNDNAGDDFYQLLMDAHRGLDDSASLQLNARLVLLLANQVGDLTVLREAIRLAAEGLRPE